MPTPKKTTPKQPDRKTVCLGDMYKSATEAVRAKQARNLSALIREALRVYLNGERQALDPKPIIKGLDKLRSDLARVGSNLNQLAHAFNIDGPAGFNRDAMAITHDELRAEFRQVIGKLLEIERELRRAGR